MVVVVGSSSASIAAVRAYRVTAETAEGVIVVGGSVAAKSASRTLASLEISAGTLASLEISIGPS